MGPSAGKIKFHKAYSRKKWFFKGHSTGKIYFKKPAWSLQEKIITSRFWRDKKRYHLGYLCFLPPPPGEILNLSFFPREGPIFRLLMVVPLGPGMWLFLSVIDIPSHFGLFLDLSTLAVLRLNFGHFRHVWYLNPNLCLFAGRGEGCAVVLISLGEIGGLLNSPSSVHPSVLPE